MFVPIVVEGRLLSETDHFDRVGSCVCRDCKVGVADPDRV